MQQLRDNAIVAGVPHVNLRILGSLVVPMPPLKEQQRIAGVLGALDDLIDTNQALMKQCAEQIRSLYLRLIKSPDTNLTAFFEAFEVDFGAAFKGTEFNASCEGRPLLRIRDLKTFMPEVWTTERRDDETVVMPGNVVVGMDAEFRPAFWIGAPSLLNQRVCRVRGRATGLAFTREALVEPLARIEGHKTGTTVSHLNKRDLVEIRVEIPSEAALGEFEAVAEPLRAAIVELKQESDSLATGRGELLSLLLSGRVRVQDVAA